MPLYTGPGASGTGAASNNKIAWGNANCVGATSLWTPDNALLVCQGASGESFDIAKTGTGGGALVQTLMRAGTTGSRTNRLKMIGCNASGDPLPRGQYAEFKAVTSGGAYTSTESMLSIGTDTASSAPISWALIRGIKFNANGVSYNAINNGGILTNGNVTAQQASANYVWIDCWFDGAIHNGVSAYGGTAGSEVQASHTFIRCRFTNNGNGAASGRALISRQSLPASWVLIDCVFDGNNGGPRTIGATEMPIVVRNCVFMNTGTDTPGLQLANSCVVVDRCTFFRNAIGALNLQQPDHEMCDITNNILAENGSATATYGAIYDQIYADAGRCGYANNCFWNNRYDGNGGVEPAGSLNNIALDALTVKRVVVPGSGHLYTDPLFVSTASGAEDLRALAQALRSGGAQVIGHKLGAAASIGVPAFPGRRPLRNRRVS